MLEVPPARIYSTYAGRDTREGNTMNRNDLEIVKIIGISNKKELVDFAEKYPDRHIFSCKVNDSPKRMLSDGIDIRIGGYSRIVKEFTDPFDFPDGFYKHQVFIPQNDGALCLELVFPEIKQYENQEHIATLSDILHFAEENNTILTDDIPVISADTNFELGGSLTHETCLHICKNKNTGEEYVIIAMYI